MTSVEKRLHDLLLDVTPSPPVDVSPRAVADLGFARRRRGRALVAAAVSAVLLGAGLVALNAYRGVTPRATLTVSPPSVATVEFQGVSVALPAGWTSGTRPYCFFPPDRSVVTEDPSRFVPSCPMYAAPTPPPSSLELATLYGADYTLTWEGKATLWHGQPAWLGQGTYDGVPTATLTLPWLNVEVTATAPTAQKATALLSMVDVRPGDDLGVPATATSVSLLSFDDSRTAPHAVVSDPASVARVLAELRALPLVSPTSACGPLADTGNLVLTTTASDGAKRTFAIRLEGCDQVVGGNGRAAAVSAQFRAELLDLLAHGH